MTYRDLNREISAQLQSEADRAALAMPEETIPFEVHLAAQKASETAALRRQYIAKGIARHAA